MPIRCGRPTYLRGMSRGICIWWRSWTGIAARFCLGGSQHPGSDFCVEALQEALSRYGGLTSSTPIKAPSLPAPRSPRSSRTTASPSAWTAAADARTTSSSSVCGGPSTSLPLPAFVPQRFRTPPGLSDWISFYNEERGHSLLTTDPG